MRPGDIRTFKRGDGNAVVLATGVWAERRGKQIHIHITGTPTFHTTITSDPNSERYHRTLFRNLRKLLVDNHCWPFGDEGAETEHKE
jgi:glycine/D-amino acid oxidase-like deaminating enzyme